MTEEQCPPVQLAQVAVADATVYYDKLYTYLVPAALEGHIFVGSIVAAPFGRGRARPRLGVVVELACQPEADPRVKPLWDAAPGETRLTSELLAIVRYLKEATFCTWFEAVRAVIPRGAQYRIVADGDSWRLKQTLERYTETVYELAPGVKLLAGEWCVEPPPETGKKPRALSEKQKAVLAFVQSGPKSRAEIEKACGVGAGVAQTLAKRGLLLAGERDKSMPQEPFSEWEEEAIPADEALEGYEGQDAPPQAPVLPGEAPDGENGGLVLSPAQQAVCDGLKRCMNQPAPKPALLYGVTGSGKTPVFLELIRTVLAEGKTALVLVPEIGLTPQMLRLLRSTFGRLVAVQHSGLSATERVLQWRAIHRGEARVVVGTRSAVFAPLDNIGIIVVDEEQERSYQSESAPRYSAIEVARRRAARHGALLLLASATPSVTSFHSAQNGRYELFHLKERYGNIPLPAVEMVDMGAELAAGNAGALSNRLAGAIADTINQGQQVILLLNRRGFYRVAVCRSCGAAVKCGECSVPMVFHRTGKRGAAEEGEHPAGRLLCHYCGRSHSPAPTVCPDCGGELRYAGFGTQRLEEELAERLPKARVLRMDLDTTGRKGAHAGILAQFAAGRADILMGTQMVAKGLDFEKVGLVGVVGIDSLLFSQGYRAYETVFSLVTQVVGRSGRAKQQGRAMIQTLDPNSPVLNLAARQDYEAFYAEEIGFRRLALYPPFCTLCQVGFVSQSEEDVAAAARDFARDLARRAAGQKDLPLRVLGPAPMQVLQMAGSFRYRLTLKCRGDAAFRALMHQVLDDYQKQGWPRKVSVWLDFHPDG